MRNNRGFSLLEVLVIGFLASVAFFFATRSLAAAQIGQSQLSHRLRARQLVETELSKLKGMSTSYPAILGAAGNSLTYVRCFARTGVAVANAHGSTAYLAEELPSPTMPSGLCNGAELEVHITPDPTALHHAAIDAFVLQASRVPKVSYHVPVLLEPAI
jgi:type II secretory pathway pseudopilin PulG